jgi:AcrR family transcriptional regulator
MSPLSAPTSRAESRKQTEARILTAARLLFARDGYERTTIRAIAAAADANLSLVTRYFGSKQELFTAAAHNDPGQPQAGDAGQIAAHLVESMTAKLESSPQAALAMLRSMLTHPEATASVRASITAQQTELSRSLRRADAELRVAIYGAVSLGLIIGRHLLQLDGLNDASPEEVISLLRPFITDLINPPDQQQSIASS